MRFSTRLERRDPAELLDGAAPGWEPTGAG